MPGSTTWPYAHELSPVSRRACVGRTLQTTGTSWPSTPPSTPWKRSSRPSRGSSPTRREPSSWCLTPCWRRRPQRPHPLPIRLHPLLLPLLRKERRRGEIIHYSDSTNSVVCKPCPALNTNTWCGTQARLFSSCVIMN